jgi:colicin import membrane protein
MRLDRTRKLFIMTGALACFGFCLPASAAGIYFPSLRYVSLNSPWAPTSYEECSALNQQFAAVIQELEAQHEECLQGAPPDNAGGGPTCSRSACQSLHTARAEARAKSAEQGQICRERVAAYLEKKRRDDAEAQRRQAEADRQEREAAAERARQNQERSQRDNQRKADADRREREDRERHDRDAKADADRRAKEAQDEADRQAKQSRDAAQAQRDAELAIWRMNMQARQRDKDKQDQASYEKELEALKAARDLKDRVSGAVEFAKNPF